MRKEAGQGFRRQTVSLITNILSDEVPPMATSFPMAMSPPMSHLLEGSTASYITTWTISKLLQRHIPYSWTGRVNIVNMSAHHNTSIDSMQLSQDGTKSFCRY